VDRADRLRARRLVLDDLLDNIGRHSAERVVPELQHIDVGDLIPLGPGENSGMRVKEFLPDRSILWWDEMNRLTTWAWPWTRCRAGRRDW
jgi:hypothetical protein